MPGQLPDEKARRKHDELVQGIPADLKGALESARKFQDNFREIHSHAEQVSRTAFEPAGMQARKMQPSHLVEHVEAVHQHAIDLARSTMPGVPRRDLTAMDVRNQHDSIANIRTLVEENLNHLVDVRRHLDALRQKLAQLEQMYV
jgi:hypothetical protein